MLQIFIILECRGGTAGNNTFHYGMGSSFSSLGNTILLSDHPTFNLRHLQNNQCLIIESANITNNVFGQRATRA